MRIYNRLFPEDVRCALRILIEVGGGTMGTNFIPAPLFAIGAFGLFSFTQDMPTVMRNLFGIFYITAILRVGLHPWDKTPRILYVLPVPRKLIGAATWYVVAVITPVVASAVILAPSILAFAFTAIIPEGIQDPQAPAIADSREWLYYTTLGAACLPVYICVAGTFLFGQEIARQWGSWYTPLRFIWIVPFLLLPPMNRGGFGVLQVVVLLASAAFTIQSWKLRQYLLPVEARPAPLLTLNGEQQSPRAHIKKLMPRFTFLPDKSYSFWFSVLFFFVLPGFAGGVKSYFWLCLIASIFDGEASPPLREIKALPASSLAQLSTLLKSRLFPYVLLLLSVVPWMTVGRGTVWHAVVATILSIGATGLATYVMRLLLPAIAYRIVQTIARIIGYALAVFALYFVHPESSLITSAYGLILGTTAIVSLFVLLRHKNLGTILRTISARAEAGA